MSNFETRCSTKMLLATAIINTLAQGRVSMADGVCTYRGDSGSKCAIGHLITDEHYQEDELEGSNIGCKPVQEAVEQSIGRKLDRREVRYLSHLQMSHDGCEKMIREVVFRKQFATSIKNKVILGELPKYVLTFYPVIEALKLGEATS